MKQLVFALAVGLSLTSVAEPAEAQTARQLLDREDPGFCTHEDVWARAAILVKESLPAWNWTPVQRDAIEIRLSDQRFDFAHPDRVQVICSATVTLAVPGVSRSIRTRFDAVPQDSPSGSFRLTATNGTELLPFQSAFKADWRLRQPSAFEPQQ